MKTYKAKLKVSDNAKIPVLGNKAGSIFEVPSTPCGQPLSKMIRNMLKQNPEMLSIYNPKKIAKQAEKQTDKKEIKNGGK